MRDEEGGEGESKRESGRGRNGAEGGRGKEREGRRAHRMAGVVE